MGGCYGSSQSYSHNRRAKAAVPAWRSVLKRFVEERNQDDLIKAYKTYFKVNETGGFFAELAKASGIKKVEEIPKEFQDTEYEVKFDVLPVGEGEEPSVENYLDAFDFPVGGSARFLKDPVNTISVGVNNFYGDNNDERLVVIEKGGGLYLKEKGLVVSTDTGVNLESIVIKRTEERHAAPASDVALRVMEVCREKGVRYQGKIRKEKGDAFLLDTNDGRIYSMTFTRAHLIKPNQTEESDIQRQLEMEYAGYIPGFLGFEENSEKQIVKGMVDLGKYATVMFQDSPIINGWRMSVNLTGQRKYDFIAGTGKNVLENRRILPLINSTTRRRILANAN